MAVLTGAGISAESGLGTFRGVAARGEDDGASAALREHKTMGALWAEFDPMTLATPEAFAADAEKVSRWYDWRRLGCLAAEPNAGHLALVELQRLLEARGGELVLLTQNVDRLHQKAGSRGVVELHGNILEWRCTRTGKRVEPGPDALGAFPMPSPFDPRGVLRPDVVWFGEQLPVDAVMAAEEAAATCDVFMSVGTSAVVWPAAGFIQQAAARGATTVEVNAEETAISRVVDWSVRGRAGVVLPRVVEGLGAG